mgnify:CR=1 FL=1
MKANLGRQITLLGFGAMAFYASLFASGQVSIEILPQFAVSAIFFLFSGKIMRQMAAQMPAREKKEKPEVDWTYRTIMLNWIAASIIVSVMVLILVKPADLTYLDLLQMTSGSDDFPALAIP